MSHLRPIDPANPDRTKAYAEYSDDERASAVEQIESGSRTAASLGKTTSQETINLANRLAAKTPKEGNVQIEQPTRGQPAAAAAAK